LTDPVHSYLLDGDVRKSALSRQYVADLEERWFLPDAASERHEQSRGFRSRLAELLLARWLEDRGFAILGLEALGASVDIEAGPAGGDRTSYEVKFIGSNNAAFDEFLKSLRNGAAGGAISPRAAANYLLFRAYEAALQLRRKGREGIAVVVVDDIIWHRFECHANRIDWMAPSFLAAGPDWDRFLCEKRQETRFKELPADLGSTLTAAKEVWVLRFLYDFRIELEGQFRSGA